MGKPAVRRPATLRKAFDNKWGRPFRAPFMIIMMKTARTEKYIELVSEPLEGYLEDVRDEAIREDIPIIRPSVRMLLRFLMRTNKPGKILEIGTAVGFSALLMHEYNKNAKITTIENYEPRLIKARENFRKYAATDRDSSDNDEFGNIKLLASDAALEIKNLKNDEFDFVFLDAAKGQYIVLLPEIIRVLKSGGMLVSDNVLQDGDIIEPRAAVRRRDRTIYERMREYLSEISVNEKLESMILPMADGITVSIKK